MFVCFSNFTQGSTEIHNFLWWNFTSYFDATTIWVATESCPTTTTNGQFGKPNGGFHHVDTTLYGSINLTIPHQVYYKIRVVENVVTLFVNKLLELLLVWKLCEEPLCLIFMHCSLVPLYTCTRLQVRTKIVKK